MSVERPSPSQSLPWWRQLRWTLIANFVVLAAIPVILVSVITLEQTRAQAQDQVVAQLESVAELKRQQIATWLDTSHEALSLIQAGGARHLRLVILAASDIHNETQYRTVNSFLTDAVESNANFKNLFYYNTDGQVLAASDPVLVGQVVVRQPFFGPSLQGERYTQAPYYEVGQQELTIVIAQPVYGTGNRLVGVLAARLDVNTLGHIMTERTGLGDSGETYLVSSQSNYLLTPSRFEGYGMNQAYHSEGIDRAIQGEAGSGVYDDYRTPPKKVIGVYQWIPELQSAMIAEEDESEALGAFINARNFSFLLAVAAALIAVGFGLFQATRISRPVAALTSAASSIAAGDLSQRATIRQRNELGVLATVFNAMAGQLQDLVGSLEARVAARTQDLFTTLEVGQLATSIYQQDDLLPRVVDYIRERFDLYYTQIYLVDDAQRYAVLVSGTGEVGQLLLERKHRLDLSATSIVARTVRTRTPVLVEDTETSDVHMPNPLLPDTRSEVAIPLMIGDQVLGVLDLQTQHVGQFTTDNLPVFQAMANQLAAALRGAQSYAETQAAIERADSINRRLTRERWESYLGRVGRGERVGYAYDLQDVRPLSGDTGPLETVPGADNGGGRLHAQPVVLRGQPIGTIKVGEDRDRELSGEEIMLVQSVADHVAQAIEQYRAFDETEQRAGELQTVAEVSAEASTSLDLERLLWNVSNLTKERFGLYHAHIYLLDDTGEYLVLAAGAGEVGQLMLARQHRIAASNPGSLVARAHRTRRGVVINDVTQAPDFLPNPLLPETRSEMAVPLIVGETPIGVLDVQSSFAGRFTGEDVQVMTTLAAQVAIAVHNARLFAEQVYVAEQLREVDRLKSEFLASMSHELRTPLNSIIGYAEVLLDGIDGELTEDMNEDVTAIHGSGKHLLNLINDILDLAKIEAGQMDLVTEDVDLREFLQEMMNTSRVLMGDKSVDLVVDVPESLPKVHVDSLRLRQIVNNLLTNAIKFTEEGSITVHAEQDEDPAMIRVSVIDTGVGITPDNLPLVFERFRQVDQSHTRRVGGTGLGLSITRQLIQMHGGDITVESEYGHGSTFTFTIPASPVS